MTGLWGQAPERCRSARPRVKSSGSQRVPPKTKRNAQPVLQTRPARRLPGGRPGWAAPAPKPAPAQRPPESGPGLTIRALGVPSRTGHERSRAVNHGSCRSALSSQFGVGAGSSLALPTVPSKLMTVGPHWGHIPPEDHGQQRTLAVDRPRSSALPFGHNRRSSEHPGSLSHGGSRLGPRSTCDRGAWARPRPRFGKTGKHDSGFRPPSPVGVRWVVDQPRSLLDECSTFSVQFPD
jgi:hypothetical protein